MNNDIVTKARLNAALGTEGNMGFEHNDIVTVDKMNEAIAEGGGGSIATANVTFSNAATDGSSYSLSTTFQIRDVLVLLEPVTVEFPLYNEVYIIGESQLHNVDMNYYPEITGNISPSPEGLLIRGDGTITFKSASGGDPAV